MTTDNLTATLAERVMGWKVTRDRFIKSGRSWMPRWRFAPLRCLEDTFQLLDAVANSYRLEVLEGGPFTAEVTVGTRIGKFSGEPKAQALTMALAQALGLEIPNEVGAPVSTPARRRSRRHRSKIDVI